MARNLCYLVGLDLGDNKTCALICQLGQAGKLEVAGFGEAESKGWRKGVVVNLDSAALAIKKAVEAAEDAAGVPVDAAYIGVGGPHLKGMSSRGQVALGPHGREVTGEDVKRACQAAQSITLLPDRKLIYAERQEYLLDSQDGIRNPVGMSGARLEVNLHLITGSTTAHDNVVRAANRAGIEVLDTIFEALAAAEACLAPDERELGVALVDVGAGSSELIVYREGSVRASAVIPVGGEYFTNDIAVGLRTPIPEAEKMKIAWGGRDLLQTPETAVEVPSVGGRPARAVTYAMLNDIIEPRASEWVELVGAELERSGYANQLGAGLVLCGGGAKLGGLAARTEETLGLPVRIGKPLGLEKMGEVLPDPAYAALVGLVLHGNRLRLFRESHEQGLARKLKNIFGGGRNSL
jgi:cell division protein FtsA